MQKTLKYAYYPLFLIATILALRLCIQLLPEKMYLLIPAILSVLFVGLFILGERFLTYNANWSGIKSDSLSDFLQTFIVLPSASKIAELILPIVLYYPVLKISAANGTINLITEYGFITQFIFALLACEFCYYWFHRAAHNIPLLWRFHAVHHGAERLYWLNAGRFHFIEAILSAFFYFLPLLFFAPNPEIVVMIISLSSITGFLEHVNVDLKAGWLNYIFNSAELHRWHHSKIVRESNMNYGKVLIVWDLIFKSHFYPKNKTLKEAGIIGSDVPKDFNGQFMYPFRKKITE